MRKCQEVQPTIWKIGWFFMAMALGVGASFSQEEGVVDQETGSVSWRSIGPGQFGAMFGVAISPHDSQVIVSGTDMGNAFMTRDGGKSWKILGCSGGQPFANPGYRGVWGVRFDPQRPELIWIGSEHGLYRSADSGKTWVHVLGGGADASIGAIEIDPSDPDIVYAAAGRGARTAVGWSSGTIWKSADGGQTWKRLVPLEEGQEVRGRNWTKLAVDPQSEFVPGQGHQRVYLAGHGGFYVSNDGGQSWMSLENTLPGGRVNLDPDGVHESGVCTLALLPGEERATVFVTLRPRTGGIGGVYVSADGGVTWMEKNRGLEEVIEKIAETYFPYLVVTGCPAVPDILYVGTLYGISKSEDGGETWSMVTDLSTDWKKGPDFDGKEIYWLLRQHGGNFDQSYYHEFGPTNGLACSDTDPNAVAYTDNAGIGVSFDGGAHWTEPGFEFGDAIWPEAFGDRPPMRLTHTVRSRGIQVIVPQAAAIDPFDPKTLAIAHMDVGLTISRDNGTWWEWAYYGILDGEKNYIQAVLYDPNVQGRMWAAGGGWGKNGHVYRSDDGGRTFNVIGIPPLLQAAKEQEQTLRVHALALDPDSSAETRTIYAGTDWGLYRTRDGGGVWERAAIGPDSETAVYDIVLDPQDRKRLFLSVDFADAPKANGLYHSVDGGETWMQLGIGRLFTVHSLSVCEATGDLYVLAQDQTGSRGYWASRALWHSGDRGETWEERSFPGDNASLVAVHPDDPRRVYVSTFTPDVTQGSVNLYRSTDGGMHWKAIGDSVPLSFGSDANGIVFDPHDARRFLLMHASGTYEVKEWK
ncbi:MAG: hypothetical protein ABIH23_04275 [bacterium]